MADKGRNNGSVAIRIGNLTYGPDETLASQKQMLKSGLASIGLIANLADTNIGEMPDQGQRTRYQAIAIGKLRKASGIS